MHKNIAPTAQLSFHCPDNSLLRLVTVLQSGFFRYGREGDTIFSFLSGLEGFTRTYIEEEIQTIFYNGDALDDLQAELTGESPTIALSSAMPGLAGAILKKNSPCGTLRKARTVQHSSQTGKPIEVLTKLFNKVALDRGPSLFAAGLKVRAADLLGFLELRPGLLNSFTSIVCAGRGITADELLPALRSHHFLITRVSV